MATAREIPECLSRCRASAELEPLLEQAAHAEEPLVLARLMHPTPPRVAFVFAWTMAPLVGPVELRS